MAKVTIDDIAKGAGVSKTSVSFAFNNPDRLSDSTLRRILKVAEELGYSPDPLASNLKTRRTGCIGILMPQSIPVVARNPHTMDFIHGVGKTCHDAGMSLMLVPPLKGNLRRAIVRAAVDGFLTMGLEPFKKTMTVLHQRGIPFVMVDSEPTEGISCVNVDDETGAYWAMSQVLAHGHRRIAILGIMSQHGGQYEKYTGTIKRRMDGYLRALDEYGLRIDEDDIWLRECWAEPEGGYEAFNALWEASCRPTAVVTMGDIIACGVLQATREKQLDVPGDISLVGFDDIGACRLVDPPLTTVRQPTVEKGRVAAELLIELIETHEAEPRHIVLPVELVERASVGQVAG